MTTRAHENEPRTGTHRRNRDIRPPLVAGLVVVIGLAMAVSYNALEATATYIGAAETAWVYPIAVDGLVLIAVVASLVLKGADGHKFAVGVLVTYTAASTILNIWHGAGAAAPKSAAAWIHVVIAAALPVGINAVGTHLVVIVLRHLAPTVGVTATADTDSTVIRRDSAERHLPPTTASDTPDADVTATGQMPPLVATNGRDMSVTVATDTVQQCRPEYVPAGNTSTSDGVARRTADTPTVPTDTVGGTPPEMPKAVADDVAAVLTFFRQYVTANGKEPTGELLAAQLGKSRSWATEVRKAIRKHHPDALPAIHVARIEAS